MCNTIACLFFLLASTLIRPKASTWSRNKDYGLRRCKSDSHCDNNQFCFFNGDEGYCNPCIDCTERYKRKTPEDGCAKSRSLCGPCITGYMDIDGECVQGDLTLSEPTSSIFPEDRTSSENPWIFAGYVVGGISGLLLLAVCLLVIIFRKRRPRGRKEVDDQSILNMALLESGNAGDINETKNLNSPTDTPPPSVSTDSSTPPVSDDEAQIDCLIVANVDDTLTKATPCTPPPPRSTPLRRSHPPPRSYPAPQSTSMPPRIPSLPRSSSPPRIPSLPRSSSPPRSPSLPRSSSPPRSPSLPRSSSPPRSPPPPYSPPPPRSSPGPRSPTPPRISSYLKVFHNLEVIFTGSPGN